MSFREKEIKKVTDRIKSRVQIFPAWEGYSSEDKKAEYEAHKPKYTYPMVQIEKAIEKEIQSGISTIFNEAQAQLRHLDEEIKNHAGKLVDEAFKKGLESSEKISDRYIERIAEDIMRSKPEKCVITVSDKWFP